MTGSSVTEPSEDTLLKEVRILNYQGQQYGKGHTISGQGKKSLRYCTASGYYNRKITCSSLIADGFK